jgi:hypothetical protein
MLAELFMLKLEAMARTSNSQSGTSSSSQFVPIKLPVPSAKGPQPSSTKSA